MTLPSASETVHFFTVDVEEYFQVSAFDGLIPRSQWETLPSRVEHNVECVLSLLEEFGARGTFFTLGWIARHHPRVVRAIVDAGHEIASHGWWHQRLTTLGPTQFREDVRAAKRDLEDVSGRAVLGYRAPSFSIVPGLEWAFDVLLEEGYRYDSSLFPVRRRGYGYPTAAPIPHILPCTVGSLYEFPLATTLVKGVRIPAAGGGYLRHFPFGIIRRAFREQSEAGMPTTFYIHPWEVDPDQPRLPASLLTRVRHYRGLESTLPKLRQLLSEFRFTAIETQLAARRPQLDLASPSRLDDVTLRHAAAR